MGDTGTAAGEFYIHEKHARRAFQWESTWSGSRRLPNGRALYDWASNVLLGLTSGYGERPRRVVVFSMAVVVLFAAVFVLLLPTPPYHPQFGYVLVSLESFITLVLGGAAAIEAPQVRLVAQVEGFLGAVLIALFVFTLTRSIDR